MEGILHSGAASVAMLHLEAGKLVCLSKEFEFNRLDYQHNVPPSLPVLEVKAHYYMTRLTRNTCGTLPFLPHVCLHINVLPHNIMRSSPSTRN